MRRYMIACEFHRAKRSAIVADCIRRIASEWQHPVSGVWIVETSLSANDIRAALLVHLDREDRMYICEAGASAAEVNTLGDKGEKVTQIEEARTKSRILADIFSRNGRGSRHLKAATGHLKGTISKNLRSA
jgi:hypothetical protein